VPGCTDDTALLKSPSALIDSSIVSRVPAAEAIENGCSCMRHGEWASDSQTNCPGSKRSGRPAGAASCSVVTRPRSACTRVTRHGARARRHGRTARSHTIRLRQKPP